MNYPLNFIALDTETTTIREGESEHTPQLTVGVAEYVRLSPNLDIMEIEEIVFDAAWKFWMWFDGIASTLDKITLYAHNWSFDWQIIEGFKHMQLYGYTLSMIIDTSPPIIMKFKKVGCEIMIVDTLNYFRQSLATMGETAGIPKMDIDFEACEMDALISYCRNDVKIVRICMISLMRFLRDNDLCRLTNTVASLALAAYTRKFMPCEIFIDGDQQRVALTRQSYFGGRTECFRMGKYTGKYYLIDVNSMYPYVMATRDYPTRSFRTIRQITVEQLESLLDRYCVTAVVRLNTQVPAFPHKIGGRTCFPVGQFVTTLSTPEIKYALEIGAIKSVETVVVHHKARIFAEYVDYFYTRRIHYRAQGSELYQEFCKKLMNSLYGKFGQRADSWELTTRTPRGTPGIYTELDLDLGITRRFLEVGGVVMESIAQEEARDSFPAIAAHVTAEARIYLQYTIDYIGRDHCYYTDTDSLLIDQEGYERMKDRLDQKVMGCWSLDGEYEEIDIRGLKDYKFGTKERIKGVRAKHTVLPDGSYRQLQFRSLRGSIRKGDMDSTLIKHVSKSLNRKYNKGIVGSDGVVHPFFLDILAEDS